MKRFTEWNRGLRTAAILLFLFLLQSSPGGSDTTKNSTDDSLPDIEGLTGNFTFSWEDAETTTFTNETNVKIRHKNKGYLERTGGHGKRRSRTLHSWIDSSNCTFEAVMHEMSEHGRLPIISSICHSHVLTLSRQSTVPMNGSGQLQMNRTSYSFSLSTLDSNDGTILNATLQFPINVPMIANMSSSVRISVGVQLFGKRDAMFRGFASERFRQIHLPSQICFRVSAAPIVQALIRNGSESLRTNIRITCGIGTSQSHSAFEEQIRQPFMSVDVMRSSGLCRSQLRNFTPQTVL